MKETLSVLIHMGTLHRLAPLWLLGVILIVLFPTWWAIPALAYGAVMQFLVEYIMHRFLYHRAPPTEQSVFNDLYRSHIAHHEFPTDAEYFTGGDNWFALKFGLISATLHTAVMWPFLGLASALYFAIVMLFVGSVSAFTFYEYCHTLAHLNVKKGWFGRHVTRKHMAHHYQDHNATFHVSFGMDWIDRLFGTAHDRAMARDRFDRKTLLSLGMDPQDLRLVTARKAYGITKLPGERS